jgi:hypothetical protein
VEAPLAQQGTTAWAALAFSRHHCKPSITKPAQDHLRSGLSVEDLAGEIPRAKQVRQHFFGSLRPLVRTATIRRREGISSNWTQVLRPCPATNKGIGPPCHQPTKLHIQRKGKMETPPERDAAIAAFCTRKLPPFRQTRIVSSLNN